MKHNKKSDKTFDKTKKISTKEISASIKKIADCIKDVSEKSATLKIGKKTMTVRPFKTGIAVAVIILVVAVIAGIASGGTNIVSVRTEFEANSYYSLKPMGDKVVMYNNKGAVTVNESGRVISTIDCAMTQPIVETAGKYLLLADLSGNHYSAAYKNGEIICEYNTDKDIISAKITDDGYAAIATDTDGYKACVTVYNNRGNKLYTWNSGSGYITDIDITDDGRYLAVAQLITSDGNVDSCIRFIDTRRDEVIGTAERKGEATAEVKFISGNKLIAVTEEHILSYNISGKQSFDVSLEGRTPSLYCVDSDDRIGVVVLDNRGNHVLEIYTYSGKLSGSYTADSEIRAVAMCNKTAAVTEQKGIVRVSSGGKPKAVVKLQHDIKDICFFDSGRLLATGASEAETLNLR